MSEIENPALREFIARIGEQLVIAQVIIRREGAGYELRHIEDRDAARESLCAVPLDEVRALAQYTASGEFRPLKSAPTLQRGWGVFVNNDSELGETLSHLYPGAVADWFATLADNPPVTHYRDYVNRQSGMYRITAMLTDAQAANVTREVCAPAKCLKQRFWTVPGLASDMAVEKSLIPCLEPCAILMEAARVRMREIQQSVAP